MGYAAIALTISLTVLGQLLLKLGMSEIGARPEDTAELPAFFLGVFLHWKVTLGLLSAVGAAFAWMVALSKVELSVAYPFMALAIVSVLALSPVVLGEHVPMMRWVGVGLVSLGLVVAAQS